MSYNSRLRRPIETDVIVVCKICSFEMSTSTLASSTVKEAARYHVRTTGHLVRISRTTVRDLRPVP